MGVVLPFPTTADGLPVDSEDCRQMAVEILTFEDDHGECPLVMPADLAGSTNGLESFIWHHRPDVWRRFFGPYPEDVERRC